MTLRVLNDTHFGVNRTAGTTLASKDALRGLMLSRLIALLPDSDLMILGDLFDGYQVPNVAWLEVHNILRNWLSKGFNLYLVPGNHDLSKVSNTISNFHVLASLLEYTSPATVRLIDKPTLTPYGYVIPHLPNQTMFDTAIAEAPACAFLFLHCNYDNYFAVQSDHSLNLSKEQASQAKAKYIVIAHEHKARTVGNVIIPGNQICSSISDWVNASSKSYLEICLWDASSLPNPEAYRLVKCAEAATDYLEADWRTLDPTPHLFIRVVGTAKSAEAGQVVSAIAKFRAKSSALVISNAVQIEADEALMGFSESLESVQGFDVWAALGATMTVSDMEILRGLT